MGHMATRDTYGLNGRQSYSGCWRINGFEHSCKPTIKDQITAKHGDNEDDIAIVIVVAFDVVVVDNGYPLIFMLVNSNAVFAVLLRFH